MAVLWIGLGSNIGNRSSHIFKAIQGLGDFIDDMESASIYETAPRDFIDQDDFLNTVVRGECSLHPIDLLKRIHVIESEGGRDRTGTPPKGPRTIDIDILMLGDIVNTWEI